MRAIVSYVKKPRSKSEIAAKYLDYENIRSNGNFSLTCVDEKACGGLALNVLGPRVFYFQVFHTMFPLTLSLTWFAPAEKR